MLTSDTDNTFLSGLLIGLSISFMYVFPIYLRDIYLYSTTSLYGVMVAQAWIYTSHCKEDPRWLKSTVSSVLCVFFHSSTQWSKLSRPFRVLETLHTVFMVVQIYHYAIVGFGRPDIISRVHWYVSPKVLIVIERVIAHD